MEAFAGGFLSSMNGFAVVALVGIGRETGLFEIMAKLATSTSLEIADAAGLSERYVREWLGGMTLGRVIEYDAATRRYALPPEHAAFLTADAGPNDLSILAATTPYVGSVWGGVVRSFRDGGGVAYAELEDFQKLQAMMTGRPWTPI
jgi:hypothetical protein